jgi:hypothetical protein
LEETTWIWKTKIILEKKLEAAESEPEPKLSKTTSTFELIQDTSSSEEII